MTTHHTAKGLASLGRHGDTMLMHVSPSEVAGLKAIGDMTGRKLTTNPHTGMPEAFSFGDFFTSLMPTLVGVALAPETGGASLGLTGMAAEAAPIVGGMATGAALAGAKGEDPLMGGVMGGLGGWGGKGLGSTFAKMGENAATQAAQQGIKGGYVPGTVETANTGLQSQIQPSFMTTSAPAIKPTGFENLASGVKQLASDPTGQGWNAFKAAGGSGMKLGVPVGMAALQGAQEDLYPEFDMSLEEKRKAEENKYKDPVTGRLNLAQASPGLRLATGGTVGTNQSTVSTGGLQDLYGANDNSTGTTLSQDGYGIGRLNALAAEGSRAKAADTFYAEGGPIAFADGGMATLLQKLFPDLLAQLQRQAAMANPSTSSTPSSPSTINPINEPGMFPQAADNYMATKPTDKGTFALQAAKGGYLDGAGDGMSDSIPATIEGKQPARLADGEFVIPADVVSHIGNGSSKAGSQKLYSMLDRVRKARTGHTKQGKEINPNKYMPA